MGSAASPAAGFSGLSAIGRIAITVADMGRAVAHFLPAASHSNANRT
jgi:hypothetical protein